MGPFSLGIGLKSLFRNGFWFGKYCLDINCLIWTHWTAIIIEEPGHDLPYALRVIIEIVRYKREDVITEPVA